VARFNFLLFKAEIYRAIKVPDPRIALAMTPQACAL
jgi:hypothetical protein